MQRATRDRHHFRLDVRGFGGASKLSHPMLPRPAPIGTHVHSFREATKGLHKQKRPRKKAWFLSDKHYTQARKKLCIIERAKL